MVDIVIEDLCEVKGGGKMVASVDKASKSVVDNMMDGGHTTAIERQQKGALRSWHGAHHFHQNPQDLDQQKRRILANGDGGGQQQQQLSKQELIDRFGVDFGLIEQVRLRLKEALELKQVECSKHAAGGAASQSRREGRDDVHDDRGDDGAAENENGNGKFKYSKWHYEELMDPENSFTCWRYIMHTRKSISECVCLMLATLEWRYHNKVDPCMNNSKMIKEFWHMTPVVRCGRDKSGNSVYCIIGRHYRKPDSMLKDTIRAFIVNLLFEWDRIYTKSFQKLTIIFDVSNTGYQNIDLDYMSWMVSIRDFLPSRIAHIYVIGIPFLIRPIVRLIISWLPDNFRNILQCGTWQELVLANIDDCELPEELGGSRPDERLAPPDAPWWCESELFEKDKIEAIEWCIGFSCDQATRDKRRQMQLEFEASLALPAEAKKLFLENAGNDIATGDARSLLDCRAPDSNKEKLAN